MSSALGFPSSGRRGGHRFAESGRLAAVTVLWLLLAAGAKSLNAQLLPTGARSLALGGVTTALGSDIEAVFHNPAALSRVTAPSAALFLQRPYGLPDLLLGTVSVALPLSPANVGVGWYTFGNGLFSQQAFVVSASRSLRWGIDAAVTARYLRTWIDRYGSDTDFGFDLAMLLHAGSRLDWGFYVRQFHTENGEALGPAEIAVGFGYQASQDFRLIAELYDDPQFEPDFRIGIEVQPVSLFTLRAGGGLTPARFTAGFGVEKSGVQVDYALFTHEDLGVTHQLGVALRIGGPPNDSPVELQPEAISNRPAELNLATEEQLTTVPGIGPTLAARIVAFRREHGPFERLEDLLSIPGIGERTLERLRSYLKIAREERP